MYVKSGHNVLILHGMEMCDATVNGRMVAALLADVLLHNYRDDYHKNRIYKKYRIYRTPQKNIGHYMTLFRNIGFIGIIGQVGPLH